MRYSRPRRRQPRIWATISAISSASECVESISLSVITERVVGVSGRTANSSDLVKGSAPGYCPVSVESSLRAQHKAARETQPKITNSLCYLPLYIRGCPIMSHNRLIMAKSKRVGGYVREYSGQSGSHEDRLERDLKRRRKEFRKRIIDARKAV